ncbi:MAG TPA: hypothetical protein VFB62_08385 [Polyangiaceae bacterium]|jgi:hypothetical protein|nr:hypothetical protein [Polyangiaceae bacterium]
MWPFVSKAMLELYRARASTKRRGTLARAAKVFGVATRVWADVAAARGLVLEVAPDNTWMHVHGTVRGAPLEMDATEKGLDCFRTIVRAALPIANGFRLHIGPGASIWSTLAGLSGHRVRMGHREFDRRYTSVLEPKGTAFVLDDRTIAALMAVRERDPTLVWGEHEIVLDMLGIVLDRDVLLDLIDALSHASATAGSPYRKPA